MTGRYRWHYIGETLLKGDRTKVDVVICEPSLRPRHLVAGPYGCRVVVVHGMYSACRSYGYVGVVPPLVPSVVPSPFVPRDLSRFKVEWWVFLSPWKPVDPTILFIFIIYTCWIALRSSSPIGARVHLRVLTLSSVRRILGKVTMKEYSLVRCTKWSLIFSSRELWRPFRVTTHEVDAIE